MPAKTAPQATTPKPAAPAPATAKPEAAKPEDAKKGPTKQRKANFSIYIVRALKASHPKFSIGRKALHAMNSIAMRLATSLADSVNNYITTKTITTAALRDVVQFQLPAALAGSASAAAAAALTAYTQSQAEPHKEDHRSRAKLVFPPGLAEKFLRRFGKLSVRVGVGAGVYLAAVLEHVVRDVLVGATAIATEDKRMRIKPRHILLAVRNEAALNELLLTKLGVVIPEGGVVPGIHPSLTKPTHAPKRRRAKAEEGAEPHKRRFRPGTVALRNIRKQQKTAKLQIQHAPFRRACLDAALLHIKDKPRFSADFLHMFHEYVEARVVAWFEGANLLALHSGRQTVAAKDVHAYISMKEAALFPADADKSVLLSNEGLRRLSQRAGVKMIGAGAFVAVKQYLHRLLDSHFRVMCPMLQRDHKKTFDGEHVKQTLNLLGVTMAA